MHTSAKFPCRLDLAPLSAPGSRVAQVYVRGAHFGNIVTGRFGARFVLAAWLRRAVAVLAAPPSSRAPGTAMAARLFGLPSA